MNVLEALQDRLGAAGILTGDALSTRTAGWNAGNVDARAVLRPRSTDDVAAIVSTCHQAGQSVVVHGGLTGLVQGAAVKSADIVISLELMSKIESVDAAERILVAEAGARLQQIQETADAAGLMCPLDIAARGSCTIGGNLATNAGGNRVIRYGMTRDMVLGLEAVLADGTVLSSMNRMVKNNAGYDLKHLFIGTEGTLGIVTRVVLKLVAKPTSACTALVTAPSFEAVARLLEQANRDLSGALSSFEIMWPEYYAATVGSRNRPPPIALGAPFYVLLETLGSQPESDSQRFESTLAGALERGVIDDAVIAQSESERTELWAIRDESEHVANDHGAELTFDVSLPLARMAGYVDTVRDALATRWSDSRCFVFGHVGDGNLHLMIATPDCGSHHQAVESMVYGPLESIGGSISAEHGIGLEKKPYLGISRTPAEIALMRTLKRSLDPKGILNPGKIFDT